MDKEKPSDIAVIVRCVVAVSAAVVSVIGSLMVLGTLIFVKYPKIPLFVVIGSLAIADICRVVSEVPLYVIQWTYDGDLVTAAYCKASVYISESSIFVSAFCVAVLSIARLLLLTDRGRSRKFVNGTYFGCLTIWIVTLATNIPNIISSTKHESSNYCIEENSDIGVSHEVKLWLYVTFSFFFQLILVIAIYLWTYILSKKYFSESYSRKERRLSWMVNIIIVTFFIFKFPYIVVKLYEFYTSRKVKDLLAMFTTGEIAWDDLTSHEDVLRFVTMDEILRITECVSLLDLGIRPFIYYKLSYYFSNSFDRVINCNKYNQDNRNIRVVARRRRNDTENTTCTTITIDTARTPLNDDISEGGSSENGSINGSHIEGSFTEYRFEDSALNDEFYDGSYCENLYDIHADKRDYCDDDVRVRETNFLCDDSRRVQSAIVLCTNRHEDDPQSSHSTNSRPLCHSTDGVVFET